MTPDILLVFSILTAAAIMFSTNLLRSDLVAMLVLLALLLTGTLAVNEALAGFSDPTVFIVFSMFIVSEAIVFSGMMTLIATTPNLIVNNALSQKGLDDLSSFSFTPFGTLTLIAAILFMATFGRGLLIRDRKSAPISKSQTIWQIFTNYGLEKKVFRMKINPGSPLIDRAVARGQIREQHDLQLSAIAIDVAITLGVPPHAFAMTVAIAYSAAYATPVSSP